MQIPIGSGITEPSSMSSNNLGGVSYGDQLISYDQFTGQPRGLSRFETNPKMRNRVQQMRQTSEMDRKASYDEIY